MEFGVVLWSVEWTFWSDIVGVVYGVILLEWYCGVWSGRFGAILLVVLWSGRFGVILLEWYCGVWSGIWSDIVGVDVLEWY